MTPEMAEKFACYLESHPQQCRNTLTTGNGEFDKSCCLGHGMKMLGCQFERSTIKVGNRTGRPCWADAFSGSYQVLSASAMAHLGIRKPGGEFYDSLGNNLRLDIGDLLYYSGYDTFGQCEFWSLAEMNDLGVPHIIIAKVVRRYYGYL
jgi:hypothetical protein